MPESIRKRTFYSAPAMNRLMLLAAWGAALVHFHFVLFQDLDPESLILVFLALPAGTVVWILLRLIPTAHALARRPYREELALTMLEAREHLRAKLWAPIKGALTPLFAIYPAATLVFWLRRPLALESLSDYAAILIIVCCAAASCQVAIAGVFDLTAHYCRRSRVSPFGTLRPLCWIAAAALIPAGVALALPGMISALLFGAAKCVYGPYYWFWYYGLGGTGLVLCLTILTLQILPLIVLAVWQFIRKCPGARRWFGWLCRLYAVPGGLCLLALVITVAVSIQLGDYSYFPNNDLIIGVFVCGAVCCLFSAVGVSRKLLNNRFAKACAAFYRFD